MSKELILDNEYAFLWFYPQTKVVHSQIKKIPTVDGMKEVLNKACEVLKDRKATKFLTDARNSGTLPKDFDVWRENDWLPRMVLAGWKFWSPVFPASVITKLHIQRFGEAFKSAGVNVHPCADPEESMKWLESQ